MTMTNYVLYGADYILTRLGCDDDRIKPRGDYLLGNGAKS
jgi:hypothetical protein